MTTNQHRTTDVPAPTRRPVRSLIVASLLLAPLAVTACGSDGNDAEPAPVEPVEITAIDYAFVGVPDEVPAGTELTLSNDSEVEVHELVAIRLPDDEDRSVAELVTLPPEELAAFFPAVDTVLIAPPMADGMAVEGTGVLTEPGRYALICVIPTGADPDDYLAAAAEAEGGPPQVDGGPPHIVEGMFAELTVTG